MVIGAGGRAAVLPAPLPTPVLAFAIRHLGADAGVMVTASHNPPQDNGYKVYLGDGSQIVPPADAGDRRRDRRASPRVADVPLADDGWETLGDDVLEAYLGRRRRSSPPTPRATSPSCTPPCTAWAARRSPAPSRAPGFPAPIPVASQAEPDPMFPTVAFPNPEEPGAMDAALELAEQTSPDVVIANDPDADRCAVAVPGPRRLADAARRRGGRAARLARAAPRRAPTDARLRQLDRLVAPARGDGRARAGCATRRR